MPHTSRWNSCRPWLVTVALLLAMAAGSASASALEQESRSTAAARELGAALDAAGLDAIAAPDPETPGTWVAALYFKGTQLLVVSAQYAAPTLFDDKAKAGNYRDIYIDLNSASVAGTKVFVMDSGADGLIVKPSNDDAADSWEEKDKTVAFDGEWRKADMSEDEYRKAFAAADGRYSRMLSLLTAQLKAKTQ